MIHRLISDICHLISEIVGDGVLDIPFRCNEYYGTMKGIVPYNVSLLPVVVGSILEKATAKERTSISDFIKKFVEWIKSKLPNYAPTLEQLENKWLKPVKDTEVEAKENSADDSGVKYSIEDDNQNEVIDLSLDKELLARINNSDKSPITVMRDYIFEKLGGREIELSGGTNAIVDKNDAKHIASNSKKDMQKAELSSIEDIISKAKLYDEVIVKHNKFNKFKYYEVPVKYNDDTFFVTVNVGLGNTDSKYHIYDLTEPKNRNTPDRINGLTSPKGNLIRKGVSNYSIPTTPETVKENFDEGERQLSIPSENVRHNQERYLKWLWLTLGKDKAVLEDKIFVTFRLVA